MPAALRALFLTLALVPVAGLPVVAQTSIELKGLRQDTTLPVEVTSDSLSVDQGSGQATFAGNVKVTQVYLDGRVLFASPTDAAEADAAVYTIASGEVVMTGDVLLTQGQTTISGNRLVYDLDAGTGSMEGRVQTVFVPGKANP